MSDLKKFKKLIMSQASEYRALLKCRGITYNNYGYVISFFRMSPAILRIQNSQTRSIHVCNLQVPHRKAAKDKK